MMTDAILLDSVDNSDLVRAELGGGSLVAFTTPAPGKPTGNEDSVAAIPYGPAAAILVIADGAGGLPGGRKASRTAVASLQESLHTAMSKTMLLRTAILDGIDAANQAVLAIGNGSATTMTVITIEGYIARSYQIGDSKSMVVGQRGRVRAQTMSHSPTGFAVEAGFLDHRDALHHEERHLVSNFIGSNEMRIEMGPALKLNPRDTVLLASDGLTDNVHNDEIIGLIRSGSLNSSMESLTSLASRRMTTETLHQPSKPDDLSVILFRKPYQTDRRKKS